MSQRVVWTNLETHFMLTIMRDKNILGMLDAKRYRNSSIFQVIEEEMKKRGFLKTVVQIRTKWKQLKLKYFKTKRINATSGEGRVECEFWEELEELLGHRPAVNIEGGVDTSDLTQQSQEELLDETLEMADTLSPIDSPDESPAVIVVQVHQDGDNQNENDNRGFQSQNNTLKKTARNEQNEESLAGTSGKQISGSTKRGKKGSYKEALASFTKEWKITVEGATNNMIEKQAAILKKEFEEQREWEQKLLREEREASERMINNVITGFFSNMRRQTIPVVGSFPHQYVNPFINSSFSFNSPATSPSYPQETKDQENKGGDDVSGTH